MIQFGGVVAGISDTLSACTLSQGQRRKDVHPNPPGFKNVIKKNDGAMRGTVRLQSELGGRGRGEGGLSARTAAARGLNPASTSAGV